MTDLSEHFEATLLRAQATLSTLDITFWENKLSSLSERLKAGDSPASVARQVKALYGGFGSILDNGVDATNVPKGMSTREANALLFHSLSELYQAADALTER